MTKRTNNSTPVLSLLCFFSYTIVIPIFPYIYIFISYTNNTYYK